MKFKKLSIMFGLLYLLVTTASQAFNDTNYLQDPEHQFWFDIDDLPTMKLHFSEDQWHLLLSSTSSVREEVSGDMTFIKGGVEYPLNNIGIKISGNTSFELPEQDNGDYVQANFTLDFDEFVDDQALSGITKLKLKRFKDDQSYVREPLSNHIMQNFNVWTAHSSTYARLDISVGNRASVYFGVYRMNESVNRKEYLDKRFGPDNDSGFLWQGNHKVWGKAHFSRINESWGGVGESDQSSFEYKSKGSKYAQARAQLVELAQNFSNLEGQAFEDYVALHINIPLLLKGLASEAVLGHWDGFWGNGNNFFIYIDESEVMHFVPYDTDNTLGTSLLLGDVGERDPLQFVSSSDAPLLVQKILAIKRYSAEYQGYLKDLVTESGLMRQEDSLPWIESVHQLIRDELENDTGDNEVINDRPASWGNESRYRIFNLDSGKNWYETRRNAVLSALGSVENIYASVYYRGVSNNWEASLMEQVEPNIWRITVMNGPHSDATGSGRFKFDIHADWSQNLGDDDADGIVEATGADILFTEGEGEYKITFYALDGRYEVEKLNVTVPEPSPEANPDNGSEPSEESNSQTSSGGSSSVIMLVLLCLLLLIRRRMAS